jgi:cleavage and polyadenylation specificity factor subunit 4
LTPTGCPLGPLHCPLRHTTPSSQNFQSSKLASNLSRDRERLATVCKHWLRGLCKKSDACEFLHEYNLRRMPECWWYAKYGYCSAGDECLYAHPRERRIECPDYKRGFCKLGGYITKKWPFVKTPIFVGATCPRKHVRRVACQLYLSGFCPMGPECPRGQYVNISGV